MYRDKAGLCCGAGERRLEFIEDLNRYIAVAPHDMAYDKSARTYVRGQGFDCKFRPPDAAHYLALLRLVAEDVLEREELLDP